MDYLYWKRLKNKTDKNEEEQLLLELRRAYTNIRAFIMANKYGGMSNECVLELISNEIKESIDKKV